MGRPGSPLDLKQAKCTHSGPCLGNHSRSQFSNLECGAVTPIRRLREIRGVRVYCHCASSVLEQNMSVIWQKNNQTFLNIPFGKLFDCLNPFGFIKNKYIWILLSCRCTHTNCFCLCVVDFRKHRAVDFGFPYTIFLRDCSFFYSNI